MKYAQFKKLCEDSGLVSRECSEFHWRIEGGEHTVNYYMPRGKIYVDQSKGAMSGRPERAIELAGKPKEPEMAAAPMPAHGKALYAPDEVEDGRDVFGMEFAAVCFAPGNYFVRGNRDKMFDAEGIVCEFEKWLEAKK